jgi:hypothetical protein
MEYVYKDKQRPTKEERVAKKEKARRDAKQNLTTTGLELCQRAPRLRSQVT